MPHDSDIAAEDRKGWLTSETAILMAAWPQAESIYALAAALGRTRMAVLVHATRLGLPPREGNGIARRKWTAEELRILDQEYEDALSGRKPCLDIERLVQTLDRGFDAILAKLEKRWGSDAITKVDPAAMRRRDGRGLPNGSEAGLPMARWSKELAPLRRSRNSGARERKCLSCQRTFWSEGIHNRICMPCKTSKDW